MAESVYVTGATTGLGRTVMRQLAAQGHQVAGTAVTLGDAHLIREDGGLPVYNDLFRASEIASTLKMLKTTVIVNTAPQVINALPFHRPDWDYYRRLLAEGGAALAAAAQADVKFIIHLSYAFLYGDTHGHWADETHPISTDNDLFLAAARAEDSILKGSVPGAVLRAGYTYGPDNKSLQALRQMLVDRGAVTVSEQPASWVHVADLTSAVALAVEQQPGGEIFNVADDDPISPAAFVDLFADSIGVTRPRRVSLPASLRDMLTPPDERALLETSFKVSSDKIKTRLGWSPQYPTVAPGLEQTLLAWRAAEAV
jgi:nucleoside-diphosphate-sugar epimerase